MKISTNYLKLDKYQVIFGYVLQCTPDIVATFIVAIRIYIVATFPGTKYIYSIIFRSDIVANRIIIVARKGCPKVATISEVHCKYIVTNHVNWHGKFAVGQGKHRELENAI